MLPCAGREALGASRVSVTVVPVEAIASKQRNQPASPAAVFDDLMTPDRQPSRPWLNLLDDEVAQTVLASDQPTFVVWSSLWTRRPDAQVRFDLVPGRGGTDLRWALLIEPPGPDDRLGRALRRRPHAAGRMIVGHDVHRRMDSTMLVTHRDRQPDIDPTAYVAESAVIVGNVRVAAGARILHGAVVTAEDGSVVIGEDTIVMEQSLIRARAGHPTHIGAAVMVGPHTHINGSTVGDEVFIATGAALFPGSRIGAGAEVRINGVVQVNTVIEEGSVVPIGWVAVGNPASILPPERHDEIWSIQRELNFPGTVYGVNSGFTMRELMRQQSEFYGAHANDEVTGRLPNG